MSAERFDDRTHTLKSDAGVNVTLMSRTHGKETFTMRLQRRLWLVAAMMAVCCGALAAVDPSTTSAAAQPFLGRWDLTLKTPTRPYPSWLECMSKKGNSRPIWWAGGEILVRCHKLPSVKALSCLPRPQGRREPFDRHDLQGQARRWKARRHNHWTRRGHVDLGGRTGAHARENRATPLGKDDLVVQWQEFGWVA